MGAEKVSIEIMKNILSELGAQFAVFKTTGVNL